MSWEGCYSAIMCRMISDLVINTDMMFHLQIIRSCEDFDDSMTVESSSDALWSHEAYRSAAMNLLVHVADINSAGRVPEVAGMWAHAIYGEFFLQGEMEEEAGMPLTPFVQGRLVTIWKAQVRYIIIKIV
jgi:hypothetical protein